MMKSMLIDFATALNSLQKGEVIAIPTETVYGLAAHLAFPEAIKTIFTLKGRPTHHPLILHLADETMLGDYAQAIPAYVNTLVDAFCPGPLTLILKRSGKVSPLVTGGQDTVGLRFPAHPVTRTLIQQLGAPLAAPSANRFGRISPTCASHVFSEFGEAVKILEGGACELGIESTIVDATHPEHCAILRHGHITHRDLQSVLEPSVRVLHAPQQVRQVSGTLKKHYAPAKPTFLFSTADELLALHKRFSSLEILSYSLKPTTMASHPIAYAKMLYHSLRHADASLAQAIAIESPPLTPEWIAIHDRLTRACYHKKHDT